MSTLENVTAQEVVKRIEAEAAKKAPRKPPTRKHERFSVGDVVWQGDIAIQRLKSVPRSATKTEKLTQLAPGRTRGARHLVNEACDPFLTFYEQKRKSALDGPIIEVSKDGELRVDHPDHGTVILPGGAVYKVGYQRQYVAKNPRERRRVID